MLWDILFAVGIGLSQLVLTWYGVHVSVQENRIRNAVIIGLVGLIGIGLTVGGTIRNSVVQDKLQAQQNKIQQNTEKQPTINIQPQVTMPTAPAHTHVDFPPASPLPSAWMPFREGEEPAINIAYKNIGDFYVEGSNLAVIVVLVPSQDIVPGAFRRFRNSIKDYKPGGVLVPHVGSYNYNTFLGPKLINDDVYDLNHSKKGLCAFGIVRWHDDSGRYETHCFQCFQVNTDGSMNIHMGPENNAEYKLP